MLCRGQLAPGPSLSTSLPVNTVRLPALRCRPLSPELRRRVQREWAPFYRDFGYPLEGEGEEEEAAPSAPPLAPS